MISLYLNIDSHKLIFVLSGVFHQNIFQLDIKAAYLNAFLNKDAYITITKSHIYFLGRDTGNLTKSYMILSNQVDNGIKNNKKILIDNNFEQIKYYKKIINLKYVGMENMMLANILTKISNDTKILKF